MTNNVNIANKRLEGFFSLMVPTGEIGTIRLEIGNWHPDVKIKFVGDGDESKLNIVSIDNGAIIEFVNWNNVLGTATNSPVKFATLDTGETLYFMASQWKIGSVNKIDIYFLVGE